ncbi:hypothetical protein D3C81_1776400 [compost metagenome]
MRRVAVARRETGLAAQQGLPLFRQLGRLRQPGAGRQARQGRQCGRDARVQGRVVHARLAAQAQVFEAAPLLQQARAFLQLAHIGHAPLRILRLGQRFAQFRDQQGGRQHQRQQEDQADKHEFGQQAQALHESDGGGEEDFHRVSRVG